MSWTDYAIGDWTGALDKPDKLKKFSTLSPNQQGIDQRISDYLSSRVGQGMARYPGQFIAGMSPYEQQGMNTLGSYLGGMGQYMPQRQAAYGQALGGQALRPIDMSASKDWFEQRVVPQYMNRFEQFSAPALEQAKAMGARASSSGMNQALAEQSGQMSQYLGDQGYQYMLAEQQAQRQREEMNLAYQMQAMGQMEPERLEQLGMVQASQQYGALPRMLEQANLDADFQEWLRTQPEYSPVLQQALAYLGIQMQGTYFQPQPGWLSQLAGATGQVASIVGNVRSIAGGAQGAQGGQGTQGGMGGGSGSGSATAYGGYYPSSRMG